MNIATPSCMQLISNVLSSLSQNSSTKIWSVRSVVVDAIWSWGNAFHWFLKSEKHIMWVNHSSSLPSRWKEFRLGSLLSIVITIAFKSRKWLYARLFAIHPSDHQSSSGSFNPNGGTSKNSGFLKKRNFKVFGKRRQCKSFVNSLFLKTLFWLEIP